MKEPCLAQCRKRKASSEMDAPRKVRCDWDDLGASGVVDSNLGFEGEGKPCQVREKQACSQEAKSKSCPECAEEQRVEPPASHSQFFQETEDLHREAGISPSPTTLSSCSASQDSREFPAQPLYSLWCWCLFP